MTDPLDELVDRRARAIVAEAKAEEDRAAREERRREREEQLRAMVGAQERELAERIRVDERPFDPYEAGILAVLACLFGAFLHLVALPLVHWTPAALACPVLVVGSSPSMRILYASSTTGNSTSLSEFTYLCRNAKVDVDRVDLADVAGARAGELAPYQVNGLLVALIETTVGLLLLVPYLRWRRRLTRERKKEQILARLDRARSELAAFLGAAADESESETAPYR